ncbi:hypothetical protein JCM8202_001681 [Rhodotorula sphaerocarpa]
MVAAHEFDDAVKKHVRDLEGDLRRLSMSIHDQPELGWNEHHAHQVLTDFMEAQQGFSVTRHAYDLETAWSAVFTSSATDPEDQDVPTIGFNSEMDALKSGHACGHNLIAISGCASAVATARTLEDFGLPGRVVLLGTPAEEGGGGKAIMLERGAYKGMDACLMLHPGGGSRSGQHGAGIITSNCISGVVATFKGRSSHAGATPEHAINALDAAFVAYSAISALRQQLPPGIKVHGIINGSDQWSPNVIPSSAEMIYGMRAESASALAELIPRVLRCFEGAATATGCSYTLEQKHLYLDLRQCAPLAEAFAQAARRCWHDEGDVGETYEVEMHAKTGASTDFGNVSHVLPALHPMFSLPEAGPGDHPHSDSYVKTTALPSSHEATLRASAALALVALAVLTSADLRDEMRRKWSEDLKASHAEGTVKQLYSVLPGKANIHHGSAGKNGSAQNGCC